jgi:hypothetical protein
MRCILVADDRDLREDCKRGSRCRLIKSYSTNKKPSRTPHVWAQSVVVLFARILPCSGFVTLATAVRSSRKPVSKSARKSAYFFSRRNVGIVQSSLSTGRTTTRFSCSSRISPALSSRLHHSDSTEALERITSNAPASCIAFWMRSINESPTLISQPSIQTCAFCSARRPARVEAKSESSCEYLYCSEVVFLCFRRLI